jgi:hypothetical protein
MGIDVGEKLPHVIGVSHVRGYVLAEDIIVCGVEHPSLH